MSSGREVDRLLALAVTQGRLDLASILRAPGAQIISLLNARVEQFKKEDPRVETVLKNKDIPDFGSW